MTEGFDFEQYRSGFIADAAGAEYVRFPMELAAGMLSFIEDYPRDGAKFAGQVAMSYVFPFAYGFMPPIRIDKRASALAASAKATALDRRARVFRKKGAANPTETGKETARNPTRPKGGKAKARPTASIKSDGISDGVSDGISDKQSITTTTSLTSTITTDATTNGTKAAPAALNGAARAQDPDQPSTLADSLQAALQATARRNPTLAKKLAAAHGIDLTANDDAATEQNTEAPNATSRPHAAQDHAAAEQATIPTVHRIAALHGLGLTTDDCRAATNAYNQTPAASRPPLEEYIIATYGTDSQTRTAKAD